MTTTEDLKPLRPSSSYSLSAWECSTCSNPYPPDTLPWLTRQNDLVCVHCIRHNFEQALHNDTDCPARWGGEELHANDFVASGALHRHIIVHYEIRASAVARRRREALAREDLEGQQVGADYQICPGCKVLVCLREGCNHVVCLCGEQFCFVCGVVVFGFGGGHWEGGGCPRWNAVGSGRERFDGV